MTKKGEQIREQILYYLERNPDGLKLTILQKLIQVSRNTLYRYLNALFEEGFITKKKDKTWVLSAPIKPQTIPGYQYQAILQGLAIIGKDAWDIQTLKGKENFKKLGRLIYSKMKIPELDVEQLKKRAHRTKEIMDYAMRILSETKTVERFEVHPKFDKDGFPEVETNLAMIITFEGGYIASDPVEGNGFAHYFIIAGIFEAYAERIIIPVYGGRIKVNILKIDPSRQIVDMGVYVIFDEQTPYKDPKTGRLISNPKQELNRYFF